MSKTHTYELTVDWTGSGDTGTTGYHDYGRAHEVTAAGPPPLPGSADPTFRGDPERWNPEQLLVASLAQCHMLSYLSGCALGGVVVTAYTDDAVGAMVQTPDGGGHFTEVVLRPRVVVATAESTSGSSCRPAIERWSTKDGAVASLRRVVTSPSRDRI